MRVLVTGARGKVGRAAASELVATGHQVVCTDLGTPTYERAEPGVPPYVRADLTDAGSAFGVVRGMDAVLHCAAIPEPSQDIAHQVFANNLLAMFNVVEACVRFGVGRLVNVSSETVAGMMFAERPFDPVYFPLDEDHPVLPQDPYALSKYFGEQLCDAAVRRSELRCITIRPTWVQDAASYERNLGPMIRSAAAGAPEATFNGWSYIDAYDLAVALRLAVESDLPGHEVMYVCSPDSAGVADTVAALRAQYGDRVEYRPFARPDASGTSAAKAERLLGWRPTRSWRDNLDQAGRPLPERR